MRSHQLYLNDISDSMRKILEYTNGIDYEAFTESSLIFDAVIRNFEIIGEAAKNIPGTITSNYPELPWSDMVGMRNILIHSYFGVDYSIVWNTIESLPALLEKFTRILQLSEDGSPADGDPSSLPGDIEEPETG